MGCPLFRDELSAFASVSRETLTRSTGEQRSLRALDLGGQ